MMEKMLSRFLKDQSGAVTVDFVMLTSGTVVLGVAVLAIVVGGLHTGSNSIDDKIVDTVVTASDVAIAIAAD